MTRTRIKQYYKTWKKHTLRSVFNCYNQPSESKIQIWNDICMNCYLNNGRYPTVLTYNCQMFTMGYAIGDVFYIITPTQTVTAKISELEG